MISIEGLLAKSLLEIRMIAIQGAHFQAVTIPPANNVVDQCAKKLLEAIGSIGTIHHKPSMKEAITFKTLMATSKENLQKLLFENQFTYSSDDGNITYFPVDVFDTLTKLLNILKARIKEEARHNEEIKTSSNSDEQKRKQDHENDEWNKKQAAKAAENAAIIADLGSDEWVIVGA